MADSYHSKESISTLVEALTAAGTSSGGEATVIRVPGEELEIYKVGNFICFKEGKDVPHIGTGRCHTKTGSLRAVRCAKISLVGIRDLFSKLKSSK